MLQLLKQALINRLRKSEKDASQTKKRFFPSRAEPPLESFQSKQPRSSSRKPLYCRHCCVCCFLLTLCSLIFSISRGASLMVRLLLLLRQRGVFLGRRYLLSLFFRCFLQKKKRGAALSAGGRSI